MRGPGPLRAVAPKTNKQTNTGPLGAVAPKTNKQTNSVVTYYKTSHLLAVRIILMTELSGSSNKSNFGVLYQGRFVLPTMATDIRFGPALSCKVAAVAMFFTRPFDVCQPRQSHFEAV